MDRAPRVPGSRLMPMEEWRPIPGFLGRYEVSNLGRVRSLSFSVRCGFGRTRRIVGRVLKQQIDTRGYPSLKLGFYRPNTFPVHRLVARAFIENPKGLCYVNHNNGIKTDARPINLEWVTKREDCQHAQDFGLNKARYSQKQKNAARINILRTPSHRKHNAH